MKKVLLKVLTIISCFILITSPVKVLASDSEVSFSQDAQSFSGQVVVLANDVNAYSEPNEASAVAHAFKAGESVFVTEESDGWTKIYYQGETLYIPGKSVSQEVVQESQEQSEELAQAIETEMEEVDKRTTLEMEVLERQQRSKRNALIWTIVIAVLVVAIIAVSVVIGIKNKKEDNKPEDKTEEKKEEKTEA